MIDKIIKVNLGSEGVPPLVKITQGDTMWRFRFQVFLNAQRYTIPENATAILSGRKPDGHGIEKACTISNNEAVTYCSAQITAVAGIVNCTLQIFDSDGRLVNSGLVLLACAPDSKGGAEVSASDLSAYQQLLAQTEDLIARYQAAGAVPGIVSAWLAEHITNPTNPPIDTSLSVAGAAADAAKVGELKSAVDYREHLIIPDISSEDFTVVNNADGSITINGSVSSAYSFPGVTLNPGKYTAVVTKISGDTTASTIGIRYGSSGTGTSWATMGHDVTKEFDDITRAFLRLNVGTYTNLRVVVSIFDVSAFDKTARENIQTETERITLIETTIADITEIRNAVGVSINLSTELNYFSADDLSVNINNGARGRSKIFKAYSPVQINFSMSSGWQIYVFKQTFSGGVQTTTPISSAWTSTDIPFVIADVDRDANYRIMFRKADGSTLINEDFSRLYFVVNADLSPSTNYLSEEIKLISSVNKDKTANKIIIALCTDNHFNDLDWKDCKQEAMAYGIAGIAKSIGANFLINLGDVIEGYDDRLTPETYHYPYVNQSRLTRIINALASTNLPLIYAIGHHEMYPIRDIWEGDSRTENRGFPMAEVVRAAFGETETSSQNGWRREINSICIDDDPANSASFYFDYEKGAGTIRFIIVDGVDYSGRGYSPGTISFVVSALTSAKANNIPVIMMCHIPPISNGVINGTATKAKNEDEYNAAIDAVGANIIAYFYGHVHHDNVINDPAVKPYPLIGFDCMKLYRQWSSVPTPMYGSPTCPPRVIDTYSEYAFDVVTIDTVSHQIDCYRFGAGDTGTYPTRSIIH